MWTHYDVKLIFSNRVMGGVPKSEKIIEAWLQARRMKDAKYEQKVANGEELRSLNDIAKECGTNAKDLLITKEESTWVGFLNDSLGLYAREHQIKAHLKDCANQVKKLQGHVIPALRDKVANKVYLDEEYNYFTKDGMNHIKEPDGSFEHGIRVDTPQGKRSALKKNDYIDSAKLSFTLKVFQDGIITLEILKRILDYGSVHGIFSERAHGYGKYNYTINEEVIG